jgi:hypothetical protein
MHDLKRISDITRAEPPGSDREVQRMFSIARLPFCGVRNASRIMSPQTQPKIVSQSGVEPLRICFALQNVDIEEFGHTGLPSRSSREKGSKSKKMSAFAKATARQSSLFSATRAKTGGKGIRTPDFQLAKLALYQLSYAPIVRCKSLFCR